VSWLVNANRRLIAAIVVAVLVAGALASVVVIAYGGSSFFPGLVAGFVGTFLAFVLALAEAGARERRRLEAEARELEQRRATEVRRRFEPVRAELEQNAESLDNLIESFPRGVGGEVFAVLNPELLEGAWIASAPRLSEVVADYGLIAELATAYGRIEELRWRLRYRTEHQSTLLDRMTWPLLDQVRDEVNGLLKRVAQQIEEPSVQPVGMLHVKGLSAGVSTTAKIETKVIRANESGGSGGEPNA
jgi:membrane protein implicated in regulation of membrane protease activity